MVQRHVFPALISITVLFVACLTLALLPRASAAFNYTLKWTATGDDSTIGKATYYDIRYSLFSISEKTWSSAIPVLQLPQPSLSGTPESFAMFGLNDGLTYYVAMKIGDDHGNVSKLSNVLVVKAPVALSADADSAQLHVGVPWPNPARSQTRLSFALPQSGPVQIEVFNVTGQRVRTLAQGMHAAGRGEVTWNVADEQGRPVANGMYFVRSRLPGLSTTRSVVVVR
jgi:hypothetical protein